MNCWCFLSPGFIGKITLQIPFYRPHSDPWVISMSQLNLIIGPAQLQEYDDEKEREEERERKKRLLKALEDKFKVGGSTLHCTKSDFCLWRNKKTTKYHLIFHHHSLTELQTCSHVQHRSFVCMFLQNWDYFPETGMKITHLPANSPFWIQNRSPM